MNAETQFVSLYSGASIPAKRIFSPLRMMVSPSMTFRLSANPALFHSKPRTKIAKSFFIKNLICWYAASPKRISLNNKKIKSDKNHNYKYNS